MGNLYSSVTVDLLLREAKKPKQSLEISLCKPGMQLAESIYNNLGSVIVVENTVLNDYLISKLENLGVKEIKVYEKIDNENEVEEKFLESYKKNLSFIKEIFSDIYSGKLLEINKVNMVTESILEESVNSYSLFKQVHKLTSLDDRLYLHSLNVAMLSVVISRLLKLDSTLTSLLVKAAIFHDIGKIKINPAILKKKDCLALKELDELKMHIKYSWDIISSCPGLEKRVCDTVLMHHEREDGSGYPKGLKENQIDELAKIVSVADLFDNLASDYTGVRSSPFKAFEFMETEAIKYLNAAIILNFLEHAVNYYIGEKFLLSTGEICEIIFINQNMKSRPLVKVGLRFLDLSYEKNVNITWMI